MFINMYDNWVIYESDKRWHHVVVIREKDQEDNRLYIDGKAK